MNGGKHRKMTVRKIGGWWFANCPWCPVSRGVFSSRRWWLACVWTREHVKSHNTDYKLVNVERYSDKT